MSGGGPLLGSIVVSTADKPRTEAQTGANTSAVKSPVSANFASQLRAKTRQGSRGHHVSEQIARDKILTDMRQNNIHSYDGEAHQAEMEKLMAREQQKLQLWKKVKENQESNFQKQL